MYFEQNGAALRLQRWLTRKGVLGRVKCRHKAALRLQIHSLKARIIQSMFRSFAARRRVKRLKKYQSMSQRINLVSLIKLQALVRRFVVIRREKNLPVKRVAVSIKNRKKKNVGMLARRHSVCFANLNIQSVRNILRWERKAAMIQKAWRRYRARNRFRAAMIYKRMSHIRRVQRWFRTVVWRRKVKCSRALLAPLIRTFAETVMKRKRAASLVTDRHSLPCSRVHIICS